MNNEQQPNQEVKKNDIIEVDITELATRLKGKELYELLVSTHPLDAHKLMRDYVPQITLKALERDTEVGSQFKAFKKEINRIVQFNNKQVNMGELQNAMNQVYASMHRDISPIVNKLAEAVNKIEKHLGLEETKWVYDDEQPTTEPSEQQPTEN